jgi:uncharacterized protein (TIGR00730 family)
MVPDDGGEGLRPAIELARICVFCGSSPGKDARYRESARELGTAIARSGRGLVYGGGGIGLMGIVAQAALAAGGEVIGVIPKALARREVLKAGLTETRVVASMHERKAMMAELSDAFVALPGGLGTFEELLEMVTWAQLGIHAKPIGILDVGNYYAGLLELLRHAVAEGFMRADHVGLIAVEQTPDGLLERLTLHRPPLVSKFLDLEGS